VNRIKIIGTWASRSLTFTPNLTFAQRLREYYGYLVFKTVMWTVDFMFTITRLRQWWRGSKDSEGFEDELEKSMRAFAKDSFGMEISEGAIYSG
jgi:aarF domain-containing kinase